MIRKPEALYITFRWDIMGERFKNLLGETLQRATLVIKAIELLPDGPMQLSPSHFGLQIGGGPVSTESTRTDTVNWVTGRILTDVLSAFEWLLEEVHVGVGLSKKVDKGVLRTPIEGTPADVVEAFRTIELKGFRKSPWPQKMSLIAEHGIVLQWQEELLSIITARNCLVHRGGTVASDDINDTQANVLRIRYRAMRAMAHPESGEPYEVRCRSTLPCNTAVYAHPAMEKSVQFRLRERLRLEVQDVIDIIRTVMGVGFALIKSAHTVATTESPRVT